MKITPVKGKYNVFNIESLTATRIEIIVEALTRLKELNELSVIGKMLLDNLEKDLTVIETLNN